MEYFGEGDWGMLFKTDTIKKKRDFRERPAVLFFLLVTLTDLKHILI